MLYLVGYNIRNVVQASIMLDEAKQVMLDEAKPSLTLPAEPSNIMCNIMFRGVTLKNVTPL